MLAPSRMIHERFSIQRKVRNCLDGPQGTAFGPTFIRGRYFIKE